MIFIGWVFAISFVQQSWKLLWVFFLQIAELEAMLGGGGRTSSNAAQKENMGDQASKACSIQWNPHGYFYRQLHEMWTLVVHLLYDFSPQFWHFFWISWILLITLWMVVIISKKVVCLNDTDTFPKYMELLLSFLQTYFVRI